MKDHEIRVGISSCVLGHEVRFNGGHKKSNYITDTLSKYFQWIPVCPEVEIGMGIPREVIRLVGTTERTKLIAPKSGTNYTEKMETYSKQKAENLATLNLDGYILKKDSPSCGMERVKLYDHNEVPARTGIGVFARILLEHFPTLPIEEEGRLNDERLRENFLLRVFCHQRWRALEADGLAIGKLVKFHSEHKFLIMAHSETKMRELGKLVATAKGKPIEEVYRDYKTMFFDALKTRTSLRKQTNVLQHIAGFIKKKMDPEEKRHLHETIEEFRQGILPLIAPMKLLENLFSKYKDDYIQQQFYLKPYPKELKLLNMIP